MWMHALHDWRLPAVWIVHRKSKWLNSWEQPGARVLAAGQLRNALLVLAEAAGAGAHMQIQLATPASVAYGINSRAGGAPGASSASRQHAAVLCSKQSLQNL